MATAPPSPPPLARAGGNRKWGARLDSWKRTWYILRKNTLALIGLGVILGLIALAIFAATQPVSWNALPAYCEIRGIPGCTYVCTYTTTPSPNCYQVNALFPSFIPPTLSISSGLGPLPLGSVSYAPSSITFANLAQGILRGADWSLVIAVSVVGAGALIGLLVGGIAGMFGGVIDEALMRTTDVFLSIPGLLFIIVVVTVFDTFSIPALGPLGSRVFLLVLALVVTWWPLYARLVRSQVLVVREQKFVEAARASGAGRGRILFRHILPNSVYPIFIQMSLDVGSVPILVGTLVFLGFNLFNVSLTTQVFPEWGSIAAFSLSSFPSVISACSVSPAGCVIPWWQIFFPGLMLFMFAISVNFLADGLRDALDPRLRR